MVQYLKRIMQLGLIYSQKPDRVTFKNPPLYNLIKYIDSNFLDEPENYKFVMEYYFFFNKAIIL